MVDVDKLSDAELRTKLLEFGFPVMPITGTTRKVMVKKLKMLIENRNKVPNDGGRKSMGQFSSEEDSDVEIKPKRDKRRITMAAPSMPAPSRSGKKTPEPEIISQPKKREARNTITSTTTSRTSRILKSAQDEFDTGSDSESDIIARTDKFSPTQDAEYKRGSPIKSTLPNRYSPDAGRYTSDTNRYAQEAGRYASEANRFSADDSYSSSTSRNVSFTAHASPSRLTYGSSGMSASDYAGDRLNQIRSRLSLGSSGYDRPVSYTSTTEKVEPEQTPFLSNFTRKLSALSSKKSEIDSKDDIVKEHDTNGSSPYTRNYLSNYRTASARGRDTIYDYKANQNGVLKNNFVSFAVLAGAALFFLFLAIAYLGLRSDTAVDLSGVVTPLCVRSDSTSQKGVNCVLKEDVENVMYLLQVIKPELHKRGVAHKCYDPTIKPQMTELEIITFCKTNFNIQDDYQIKNDLRNLEVMSFQNPVWGVGVARRENNNGAASVEDLAKDMEEVIMNNDQIISLMEKNPDLPWRCTMYQSLSSFIRIFVIILSIFIAVFLSNLAYKYYKHYEEQQKDEVGLMIEKVIDILQNSSEDNDDNYVVISHVRDMILPLSNRKSKEKLWQKAVAYINENESRVRTEVQTVKGEPFDVWRWIGAANVSSTGEANDRSDYVYRQGRRIVDVQYLIEEVLKFPHRMFFFCSSKDVAIKHEIREGFFSVYLLKCSRCRREYPVCSEDPKLDLMDVNLALVAGVVSLGLGLYELNEICSSLQLPTVSRKKYERYLDDIHEIYQDTKSESAVSDSSSLMSSVVTSTPKRTKSSFTNQSIIEDVRDSIGFKDDIENLKQNFLNELKKDVAKIEKLTRDQKDSNLWRLERKKRLTASNFGRIVKLRDQTNRDNIVKELMDSKFTGNICTEYGNKNEANAIRDFEKVTGLRVDKCGLFIDKESPFLAATPDGLVGSNAIIEVKCPFKARDLTPLEAIERKEITFATVNGNNLVLKRDDKYYFQVQGQLHITGREICYFVVWTPKGLLYEIIERDEFCWGKMYPKLEAFYFKHMLPAILDKQSEMN